MVMLIRGSRVEDLMSKSNVSCTKEVENMSWSGRISMVAGSPCQWGLQSDRWDSLTCYEKSRGQVRGKSGAWRTKAET